MMKPNFNDDYKLALLIKPRPQKILYSYFFYLSETRNTCSIFLMVFDKFS